MILDKYPRSVEELTASLRATVGSSTAKRRSDTSVTNEKKVKPWKRRSAASEVKCTA